MEIYIRVRKYGGTYKDRVGHIPRKAEEFIRVIHETLLEIPAEHRSDTTVSIEPEYELGEHYECLDIGYYREMNEAELCAHAEKELIHWQDQLRNAEERVMRCRQEIISLSKD